MKNSELTKVRTELETEYGDKLEYITDNEDRMKRGSLRKQADIEARIRQKEIGSQRFKSLSIPEKIRDEYEVLGTKPLSIDVGLDFRCTVENAIYLKKRE